MQTAQTANFIESFLTEASNFGLHLDTTPGNTGPFNSVEGTTVAKILDLKETYVFVMSAGRAILIDCSGPTGTSFPDRWVSRTVQSVEELHHVIKLRRAVQNARWN